MLIEPYHPQCPEWTWKMEKQDSRFIALQSKYISLKHLLDDIKKHCERSPNVYAEILEMIEDHDVYGPEA